MTPLLHRLAPCALVACSPLAAQDFHEFGPPSLLPELQADVRAVAAGDLDGDGDQDLVFGCYGVVGIGERNYWLRNDGTGLFGIAGRERIALTPSLTRAIAIGDFDRDGDLDALFGNQRLDALCRNDGAGHLALSLGDLPPVDRETNALATGDVDGDGDLDVVAACSGFNVLYRNDGTGVFADASASLPQIWSESTAVDLADLDGDGDLDVLLGGPSAQLLWNDGSGVFTPSALALPPGAFVQSADLDGDGDRDFVLSANSANPWSPQSARLYRNDGGGAFSWTELAVPHMPPIRQAQLVDVDDDGDHDLATNVGLLHNDGAGEFTWASAEPRFGGTFTDLDDDGDPDLVVGGRAFRNHGGTLATGASDLAVAAGSLVPGLLDFDRDGDLDALVVSGLQLQVLANDGRGVFGAALVQVPLYSWGPESLGIADWTGDDYPDVLDLAGSALLVNQSGLGLIAQSLPLLRPHAFVSADFDHDGDLDLVVAAANGIVALANSGAGVFAPTAGLPPGLFAVPLDVADFDGDGHVDLMLHQAGQPRIFRGNGAGGFTAAPSSMPAGLTAVRCGRARDLDGDGDLDLAIGHEWQSLAKLTLLANDGRGTFAVAAFPPAPADIVSAIAAADVDEDGDFDLAVTGNPYGGEATRLLRNDGGIVFVDATFTGSTWRGLPAPIGAAIRFGDVDGDGDADAVAISPSSARLLRNLRRQTRTWPEPAVGTSWRIDVHVRPIEGSSVAVIAGLRELVPGLSTPFGMLRIDPTSAITAGFFAAIGFEAAAGVTLPIPPDPALRGVALFAQGVALCGGELRFANQTMAVVR